MRKVGIDVGGTFTDVVLIDEASGRLWSTKVPTTPADPSKGASNGVRRILELSGLAGPDMDFIGHGTTIATNMLIEGKGARVALLTTKGFRDVLEIRRASRHDRADLYDLFFTNPPAIVPRRLRREVHERILYDGTVERALSVGDVRQEMEALREQGIEAVAICFLNSQVNPAHEKLAAEAIRQGPDKVFVTASCEVNPEMQEYERTCTTVINAMLGPRCGAYIRTFERESREAGLTADIFFMQSNGGLARPDAIANRPVALLESGPAGGVTAAARLCERLNIPNAITGDMGGTSFDVSMIRDFRPEVRNSCELNSYTVRVPNIDIVSIGAGGGSIAWIDRGGGVRIGPVSAGADPGPACYGRGGLEPTVTDCNLVLGYLDAEHFLDGEFKLDVDAAWRAVEMRLAKPLGVSIEQAAHTVRSVANALMAQAVRLVTVESGYDPRDFVYVPFGGAGPVHAVDLAREIEIPTVIVPPLPGLFSAFGMIVADLVHDLQAPVVRNVDDIDPNGLEASYRKLEDEARTMLRSSGLGESDIELRRLADCSYLSQAETLQIQVPSQAVSAASLKRLAADFADEHQRHWNFTQPDRPIQLVNIRIRAVGRIGSRPSDEAPGAAARAAEARGYAKIMLHGEYRKVPRYRRAELAPGQIIVGPALIDEASSSIVIDAADRARRGAEGTLMVDVGRLV
jgi:N-methylhydantoinase A